MDRWTDGRTEPFIELLVTAKMYLLNGRNSVMFWPLNVKLYWLTICLSIVTLCIFRGHWYDGFEILGCYVFDFFGKGTPCSTCPLIIDLTSRILSIALILIFFSAMWWLLWLRESETRSIHLVISRVDCDQQQRTLRMTKVIETGSNYPLLSSVFVTDVTNDEYYRKTSDISSTLVDNKIVDHSDVVGASPVGAAPTTSSFSTQHLASRDSAKTAARQYDNLLSVGIWCVLY